MKRALALSVLAGLLAPAPAHAWLAQKPAATATYQVFMANAHSNTSGSVDNYIPVNYSAAPSSTDRAFTVFPVAGTISTIRVRNNNLSVTGAQTYVITLRKNGSDTALTCTITSASSDVCAFSTPITFAAGDYASIGIHPTGSPSGTRFQVTTLFQPTVANDTIFSLFASGFSNSATQAQMPFTSYTPGAVSTRRAPIFAGSGTVDKLYVVSNAPGAAASGMKYDYTFDKNGSVTAVTCQILETATACNDTAHGPISITGASGSTQSDDVSVQAVPTATPASAFAGMSFRFLSTTPGLFPLTFINNGASDHATQTYYAPLTGSDIAATNAEQFNSSRALAMTVKSIAVSITSAPGAAASGKQRVFTLRQNGADTACTVTINETETAKTASCNISVADGDILSTSDAPVNTPATGGFRIGYLASKP